MLWVPVDQLSKEKIVNIAKNKCNINEQSQFLILRIQKIYRINIKLEASV